MLQFQRWLWNWCWHSAIHSFTPVPIACIIFGCWRHSWRCLLTSPGMLSHITCDPRVPMCLHARWKRCDRLESFHMLCHMHSVQRNARNGTRLRDLRSGLSWLFTYKNVCKSTKMMSQLYNFQKITYFPDTTRFHSWEKTRNKNAHYPNCQSASQICLTFNYTPVHHSFFGRKRKITHHQEASTSDVNQKIVTHTEKHIPLGNKFILQMFDR